MIKLPNGKLVPKDGPEAQAFFKGIEDQNKRNKSIIPPKTTNTIPSITQTTVVRRPSQTPKAGALLDRSNYKRVEPVRTNKAREFDSTRRVVINPAETPQYNTKSRLYLDSSTTQKPRQVDPVLAGK
jgi:hypothetical protein